MKFAALGLCLTAGLGAPAFGQDELIANLVGEMRSNCLSADGETYQYTLDVDVGGNLTFKGFRPGGKGELVVNRDKLEGGALGALGYVNEELRQKADASIQDCILEYMQIVLNYHIETLKLKREPSGGDSALKCGKKPEADSWSCYGGVISETLRLGEQDCIEFVQSVPGAKCGIWQDGSVAGANSCSAHSSTLKSGCAGCTAGATYALECVEAS